MKKNAKTSKKAPKSNINKEKLIASISFIITAFMENAAELGCPKDNDVDMWFRNLEDCQKAKVIEKLLKIIDKFYK